MNKKQTTLCIGLVLIGLCALFPPMKYAGGILSVNNSTTAFPGFLFDLNIYRQGSDFVTIDTGRLLAEWVLIGAVTGIVFIRLKPEEPQPDAE